MKCVHCQPGIGSICVHWSTSHIATVAPNVSNTETLARAASFFAKSQHQQQNSNKIATKQHCCSVINGYLINGLVKLKQSYRVRINCPHSDAPWSSSRRVYRTRVDRVDSRSAETGPTSLSDRLLSLHAQHHRHHGRSPPAGNTRPPSRGVIG